MSGSPAAAACEACGGPMRERVLDARNTLLQCPACDHVRRDPVRCRANARRHAWGGDAACDRIRNRLTFRSMGRHLARKGASGGNAVLEIGFGSGALLGKWIAMGWQAFGIEAEALDIPIAPLAREKAVLKFCKIEEADLPDGSFDLAYAIHVAEHLDDPACAFAKCHRMLKNGGLLYLVTPNACSLGLAWFKAAWWNLEDPTHVRFFSPRSITRMLADAGFSRIEVGIPAWDSLMAEANSVLRLPGRDAGEHGVLGRTWLRHAALPLAAAFLPLRLLARNLAPSLEIVAVKQEDGPENP